VPSTKQPDRPSSANASPTNAFRKQLIEDYNKKVEASQDKAIAQLNQLEAAKSAEVEAKEMAAAQVETKIKAWSHKDGVPRNIRTLLSTLQSVLWPGNNWKPLSITDLMDKQSIKSAHKKFYLVCHPDKVSADVEHKAIAEIVFPIVNEAYRQYDASNK